ncbi:UDP-glucose/GDP-mannose dehydrogenase family protein [Nitratireductor aquibiodomus]|uniref:UDP-glucose dehydrogenase family protein n=1 Tax=Nitratireductor aquibiodomus TaxID=204799 RepID=UPI0019D348DB|nr:UDP-glucose/GDP-mannose dehydrogenase family protein [Nitratireductor aquibiodomus]MBN7762745.1 UDP-glucose/GDP-mannose dehydrogenase family protein [Nitratireductor aquibiodomus]
MKITVFGIGYVGLVQAAVLAEVGNDVWCVDVDQERVEQLQNHQMPVFEPGLERLVVGNHTAGRLKFTTDAAAAVRHGHVQMIAVGTPPGEDGSADLKHVLAVADTIGQAMDDEKIVISKSTVPVGTCDRIRETIGKALSKRGLEHHTFHVVSNPEFLKEGSAVADCMKPDRIIVGTENADAEDALRELYAPFNRNHEKMIVMDVRSAELTKYAANAMLATKISFMNEMAAIAERVGADIEQVRLGIGSDPRIGYDFIYPGIGYGGSCFPKDVRALLRTAEQYHLEPHILRAVEARNERQKHVLFEKINMFFAGNLAGRVVALWGLSFKPNTNDMREAPSRNLMEALWRAGASVQVYDPHAMRDCKQIYGDRNGLMFCSSKEAALEGADVLAIATEWKSFRSPNFERVFEMLKYPVIFDGRNLYDPELVKSKGLTYFSVGRAFSSPQSVPRAEPTAALFSARSAGSTLRRS